MERLLNNIGLAETVKLLNDKLVQWYELIISNIPNFIMALLVMTIFIFLAKFSKKLIKRALNKSHYNQTLIDLFLSTTHLFVILFGCFISLEILNLEKTVTSIFAGAGVIGLALGFAFQEIASNFVSGIFIALKKPYRIGDIVEIDSHTGEIVKVKMRTTSLMTFDGLEVIIPNKRMFTETFKNYTTTPKRRVDLEVGVSYGDDLEKVETVTKEAVSSIENRIKDKEVEFYYDKFDSSSVNFSIRVWIHYPGNQSYLKTRHQMIKNIKKAFDANNITIPFPIRTMDFGIKGGVPLDQSIEEVGIFNEIKRFTERKAQ